MWLVYKNVFPLNGFYNIIFMYAILEMQLYVYVSIFGVRLKTGSRLYIIPQNIKWLWYIYMYILYSYVTMVEMTQKYSDGRGKQ